MANAVFENAVLRPARASEKGIERVWTLCNLWLSHIERRLFSGSYFFTGAFFEYGDRPGPVSKALKSVTQEWIKALKEAVEESQQQNRFSPLIRAEQISLELNGRLLGAHCAYVLGDFTSFRRGRAALHGRLRELAKSAKSGHAFESVEI
jgi:hypothetical protein